MKGALLILAIISFSASAAADVLRVKLTQNKFLGTGAVRFGIGCPPTWFIGAVDLNRQAQFYDLNIPNTSCRSSYTHSAQSETFIDTFTLDAGSANITFKTVGFNILEPGITALDHVGQNYLHVDAANFKKGIKLCQNSTVGGMGFYHTPAAIPTIIGSITFCGTDASQYYGSLQFVPIADFPFLLSMPLIKYGAINITSPVDGDYTYHSAEIYPAASGIYLRDEQFQAYVNATGATDHNDGNGYVFTPTQFANLKNFTITFGTCPKCVNLDLVPDAQIRPRASSSDPIRLAISGQPTKPSPIVNGITFGNAFLERYYVYFNDDNNRVGFGITRHTHQKINY